MVEVSLRPTAKSDLRDITRYTREHWSDDQAEFYLDQILDMIEQIGDHPFSGQHLVDIREGYRRRAVGHHHVLYAIMADGSVEIARILHEKLDIRRHLDEQQ